MIEKGSLVKLVNMEYEYGTGFYKPWKNGLVGTVIKHTKVTNINNNSVSEICRVKLLVPFLSTKGNPIDCIFGINSKNLEEIARNPIVRKSIVNGGK